MKKIIAVLFASALLVLSGLALATAANAGIAVTSQCANGWYVNDDEETLMPAQKPGGLLFDGPSLVHHLVAPGVPMTLDKVPGDGAFTTAGAITGVKPLFKMETTAPYSTINKTADGYWSSKITTGAGSQSEPVASPALLVGKWNYTMETTVYSFGVGYANDSGNKALVTSVTFGGKVYTMACAPGASASASPSKSASAAPSRSTSASPAVATLPVTGTAVPALVVAGMAAAALGGLLLVLARRRHNRFEA